MTDLGVTGINVAECIDLPFAELINLSDNIVWIRYKDYGEEIGIAQAKMSSAALSRLTGVKQVHLIIDFRGTHIAFTNEARDFFARSDSHSKKRNSQALIIEGLPHKLVANFYMKFNRPNCPVAVFEDPQKALDWTRRLENEGAV